MATKRTHVSFIQKIINKGAESDDVRIKNSVVAHALDQARVVLLKRELDKRKNISDFNYQTVCVDLTKQNPTICPIPFTLPDACLVSRSVNKLPKPVNAGWGEILQVQFLDGKSIGKMSLSSSHRAKYSMANLDEKTSYYIQDEYIYLLQEDCVEKIQIRGIWEDTDSAAANTCTPYSDEYPMDSHLTIPMYEMALNLLHVAYKFPEDIQNNATDVEVQAS